MVGDDIYTYDANGNLTAKPGLTMTFDYRDRLISATTESGAHLTFLYDANNIRLLKRVQHADGSESVIYYPDQYSEVRDGEVVNYVWAGERRIGQVETTEGEIFYFQRNHLGSTHFVSDEYGQIVEERQYNPYGLERASYGTPVTRYTFAEMEEDVVLGLHYLEARYYDASIGRFVSIDPIIELTDRLLENPQDLNPFMYVAGNPIKYIDDSGYFRSLEDIIRYAFHRDFGTSPEQVISSGAERVSNKINAFTNDCSQHIADTNLALVKLHVDALYAVDNYILPGMAATNSLFFAGEDMQVTASIGPRTLTGSAAFNLAVGSDRLLFSQSATMNGLGIDQSLFAIGNAQEGMNPITSASIPFVGSLTLSDRDMSFSKDFGGVFSVGLSFDYSVVTKDRFDFINQNTGTD
jgi:RHS repeat-associated protein